MLQRNCCIEMAFDRGQQGLRFLLGGARHCDGLGQDGGTGTQDVVQGSWFPPDRHSKLIEKFPIVHHFCHSICHQKEVVLLRQNAVEEDLHVDGGEGEEAARRRRLADASMWRNTQRESRKDNARREHRILYLGVALVVLGFIGQLVGSLPYGITIVGFKSYS